MRRAVSQVTSERVGDYIRGGREGGGVREGGEKRPSCYTSHSLLCYKSKPQQGGGTLRAGTTHIILGRTLLALCATHGTQSVTIIRFVSA